MWHCFLYTHSVLNTKGIGVKCDRNCSVENCTLQSTMRSLKFVEDFDYIRTKTI